MHAMSSLSLSVNAETKYPRRTVGSEERFAILLSWTARKSLILNGEMSEWLSASAAKPLRRDISP